MFGTCYWCGAPAVSVDHVPPRNLFPKDKRRNLITVPACKQHNEDLAKDDELFRFYLQASAGSPDALREFDKKTIRSLTRPGAERFARMIFDGSTPINVDGRETRALQVNPERQDRYFEKITRGLFYNLFRRQLGGEVSTFSPRLVAENLDYVDLARLVMPHINGPNAVDGGVEHPEIFSYRYVHTTQSEREGFLVRMIFYSCVPAIGMSQNQ